jgi:branched-chain amino acid transport system permease protein
LDYLFSVATVAGIYIIMALSFYLPFMTGQISLGQAGFMAVGAYASAVCTVKFGIPYIPSVLIGGIVAGIVGFVLGVPALRIKGIYLLLLTLGFGEIVRVIFINLNYVGGAAGFPNIPYQQYTLLYAYGTVLILIIFFHRLRKSRLGRAFQAIGNDEGAAEIMGVNITAAKLTAFSVGAFIAGIGGGIFAHYQEYIEPLMSRAHLPARILPGHSELEDGVVRGPADRHDDPPAPRGDRAGYDSGDQEDSPDRPVKRGITRSLAK